MAQSTMPASKSTATSPPQSMLSNVRSGFMVFLIALPLCLAISAASGCPPIAGIFTAIAGGIITTLLSNSELTIKGPAAGLIVIVLGCMTDFTGLLVHQESAAQAPQEAPVAVADEGHSAAPNKPAISAARMDQIKKRAFRMTLAVGVAAGVAQILFGIFRSGVLGEFFPSSAVHGLLAAIGVIIIAKQIPLALGIPSGLLLHHGQPLEPLELIRALPGAIPSLNPEIALIGIVSLIIMFGLPMIARGWLKKVPSQLIVLLVAVSLAQYLGLPSQDTEGHEHVTTYVVLGKEFELSPVTHLVNVPKNIIEGITTPDFSALKLGIAWKWVALFALIGSLESLLSAKAIDLLDPQKRKTDLDRDMLAVGVANTAVGFIGGIPMISEIVRSRANIDNGATSRWSNFFHAVFLLLFVAMVPSLLHLIPVAALAAMLIFTGFRLAHPREFMHVFHIGREQLVVFVATIVGILATDLLIGIFIGIGVKLLIHFINGVPISSLFKPFLTIEQVDENTCLIKAERSAVFSNWILLRRQIMNYGLLRDNNLVVDMGGCTLVDHTVMEKLHELERDFAAKNLELTVVGLDDHMRLSEHPHAARRRVESNGNSDKKADELVPH
jgi:MFS superfamily sulfate permease-like transporter